MNYASHPAWPTGDGWITPSDRAILARAPRPVPLRASAVALIEAIHTEIARDARAKAGRARRMSVNVAEPYWRDLYLTAAAESDARAAEHERVAQTWARRVGT